MTDPTDHIEMPLYRGDKKLQDRLARRLLRVLNGQPVLDIANALGSATVTLLFRLTKDKEQALKALDRHFIDMRTALDNFYTNYEKERKQELH